MRRNMAERFWLGATALFAALLAGAAAASPNPMFGRDYSGRSLVVTIDSPADGSTVPAGPVALLGRVEYDGPPFVDAAIVHAVQVSIDPAQPLGGDCNGDGRVDAADDIDQDGLIGSQRDCSLAALRALEAALPTTQPLATGAVAFGAQYSETLNLDSSRQTLTWFVPAGTDADHNGTSDVLDAIRGRVAFGPGSLDDALNAVQFEFEQRGVRDPSVALLLSSGPSAGFTTGSDSPLAQLAARGVVVHGYALLNPAGCDAGAPLRVIADTTGGQCVVAANPMAVRPPAFVPQPKRRVFWHAPGLGGQALTPDADGRYRGTAIYPGGDGHLGLFADDGSGYLTMASIGFFVADSTPDPFAFVPRTDADGGALLRSGDVWPTGFNVPVPVTVSGGRYSVAGAPATDAPGTLAPGQSLALLVTSSPVGGESRTATVSVGGVSAPFTVTTRIDQSPDPFQFRNLVLRLPGIACRSEVVTITGINVPTPIAVSGSGEPQYSINGGPFTAAPGMVRAGDRVQLSNRVPLLGGLANRLAATATLTVGDYAADWRIGLGNGGATAP